MTRWIRALRQGLTLAVATAFLALGCGKADGAAADDVSTSGGGGGLAGQGGPGGLGSGVPRAQTTGPGWSLRDDTPHGRLDAAAVVDTAGDRLIVFGSGGNDIWALALSGERALSWSQLIPEGEHPLVPFRSGVYDPGRQRLLLLVDHLDSAVPDYDDVELFELALEGTPRFQRLAADGLQPGQELVGAQLALDSAGKRLFAMGGTLGRCGLWALSLADQKWTRVADAFAIDGGLCPFFSQTGALLVFDAPRQRLVAFGDTEVWELRLADRVWRSLGWDACNGSPFFAAPAYDEARGRVIYAGGECYQVTVFDLATNQWQSAGPAGFWNAAAAVDVARDRILYFLGADGNATSQLSLASMKLTGLTPNTRGVPFAGSAMVFDPLRGAPVALGDAESPTQTHALEPAATWRPLTGSAAPRGSRAIYDPVAREIVAFGASSDAVGGIPQAKVSRLSSAASEWEVLAVPAGPSARRGPVVAYDSARRRMIVHGGTIDQTALDDTWTLTLNGARAWEPLSPAGNGPGAREGEVGAYDPVGQRLIVFGGSTSDSLQPQDLHALALGDGDGDGVWRKLEASGAPPHLVSPSVVYDAVGKRLIFVQLDGWGPVVAALELGDTPTWHTFCLLGVPPARFFGASAVELLPDGLFAALGNGTYRFDLATPYCD